MPQETSAGAAADPPPAGRWGIGRLGNRTALAVLVLAAAVLGGAGAAWFGFGPAKPGRGALVLEGNVDIRQVALAFKIPGRIVAMNVEEGDVVRQGQVVAVLDKNYAQDEIRQQMARVAAQAALLARLQNGSRPEELAQAQAQIAEREAASASAQATLARKQALASRGFAPHQAHDEAIAAAGETAAQVTAAEQTFRLAQIGPRQEDIDAAQGALDVERAGLAQAERQLADTDLIAPSDGMMQTRVREPGAIVAGGESVYTLTLTSPVWVRAYVEEPDLARAQPGMAVSVTTDAKAGPAFRGQIGFVSPVAEFTPKTVETRALRPSLVYRLRIVVANPDGALRQGMPVTVTLPEAAAGRADGS